MIEKLFKQEGYLVSAVDLETSPKTAEVGMELAGFLKRAALTKGFRLHSNGANSKVAEFSLAEDVPFKKMQEAMDLVSANTGLSLFISNKADITGRPLSHDTSEQKFAAFLKSGPVVDPSQF